MCTRILIYSNISTYRNLFICVTRLVCLLPSGNECIKRLTCGAHSIYHQDLGNQCLSIGWMHATIVPRVRHYFSEGPRLSLLAESLTVYLAQKLILRRDGSLISWWTSRSLGVSQRTRLSVKHPVTNGFPPIYYTRYNMGRHRREPRRSELFWPKCIRYY